MYIAYVAWLEPSLNEWQEMALEKQKNLIALGSK